MLSTSGCVNTGPSPNETNVHYIAILANRVHTLEQVSFINIHTFREEVGCVCGQNLKSENVH